MRFHDFRTLFQVAIIGFVLLAASPALSNVVSFSRRGESFSELWMLGPDHVAENYPFSIEVGENYSLFLGVGHHLGYSAYYLVYAKFRNQSQPLPNSLEPSPLSSVYELRFLVADGDVWETPITFRILGASIQENVTVVDSVSVNNEIRHVDVPAIWDPENRGYYFQLFFELWLYETAGSGFQFHNRFVGIWLNITV